ncbi:alpha/beta hydrolase [Microbacterium sp. SORGH_AS_0862]|uniref:alpha/beta hydrolase n=1 Tax=Microbacterium sp. SORGH_AS_0862 TaxID=3041789 RepID=UPI00279187AA|nr:alpha/beta hydrolase [Microbacterium sp. SORGH_AS_0862]MDQ1204636.1 hypothetical protein [Microbacterium sp. SORGH_AS_0862]
MAELGQTFDPRQLIPGSPESVEDLAATWQRRASLAEETGVSLRRFPAPEGWTGNSADAFESRVQSVGSRWILLSDVYGAAVQALIGYASVLRWAQLQAETAIDAWEEGQAATDAKLSVPFPNGGRGEAIQAGAPDKARAQQILADARARVAAAGDSAAASLREAAKEPQLGEDVWDALGKVTSTPDEALVLLSGLTAAEMTTVLALRPEIANLVAQAGAAGVNRWWNAFGDPQREALINLIPAVIGNLEGVSYTDRNTANKLYLDDQLAAAKKDLETAQENRPPVGERIGVKEYYDRLQELQTRVDALTDVNRASELPDRFLVSLTGDTPPLAAIAIGNPDGAANITFTVPGMGAQTTNMSEWAQSAQNLQYEQAFVDPSRTHSVIAWIGYETPPMGGEQVMFNGLAEAGATRLESSIVGVQATRGDATVNVAGHSYGTTTSSIALTEIARPVDTYVTMGSAGLPIQINEAADVNADRVFAGQATNSPAILPGTGDAWAWFGRLSWEHPVNPVDAGFGAEVFSVDGSDGLKGVNDHATHTSGGTGYLDSGTESLRNIALATTGQGDSITPEEPAANRPPGVRGRG